MLYGYSCLLLIYYQGRPLLAQKMNQKLEEMYGKSVGTEMEHEQYDRTGQDERDLHWIKLREQAGLKLMELREQEKLMELREQELMHLREQAELMKRREQEQMQLYKHEELTKPTTTKMC